MRKLFILAFLLISGVHVTGKDYIPIHDAIRRNEVKMNVRSVGGLGQDNLIIELTNLTYDSLYVQIDPGINFSSEDTQMQDLLHVYQLAVDLGDRQMITIASSGMCTQRSNYGPSTGAKYSFDGWAREDLVDLASVINETKQFNSLGQMCVWIVSDGIESSPASVPQDQMDGAQKLAEFMASRVGLTIEINTYDPSDMDLSHSRNIPEIFSVTGVLVYHCPEFQRTNFRVYDEKGKVVHNFYNNRQITPGLHRYKFGVNAIAPKSSKYYARITDQQENILKEMEVDSATLAVDIVPNELDFPFYYPVRETLEKVLIRIYLPDGKLVEEFKRYKTLIPANYTLQIEFLHVYDATQEFIVKLEDLEGKVYVEQKVGRDIKVVNPF